VKENIQFVVSLNFKKKIRSAPHPGEGNRDVPFPRDPNSTTEGGIGE